MGIKSQYPQGFPIRKIIPVNPPAPKTYLELWSVRHQFFQPEASQRMKVWAGRGPVVMFNPVASRPWGIPALNGCSINRCKIAENQQVFIWREYVLCQNMNNVKFTRSLVGPCPWHGAALVLSPHHFKSKWAVGWDLWALKNNPLGMKRRKGVSRTEHRIRKWVKNVCGKLTKL